MIGRLQGNIISRESMTLLLDVQGVGYEVEVPATTLEDVAGSQGEVVLYTHLSVRDDAHLLFGFSTLEDRKLFRLLIKVNGVGPKLALTLLSGIRGEELARLVEEGNSAALVKLPGVGKKTAERILLDMQGKLKDWMPNLPVAAAGDAAAPERSPMLDEHYHLQEAEAALVALGYKPQEAARALAQLKGQALTVEEMIRQALKNMIKI